MERLLIPTMFFAFIFYVFLQIICIVTYKGKWRIAAIIPVPLTIGIIIYTSIGASQGSNLFPILMLFSGPILFLYIVMLSISHYIYMRKNENHS
jgi:hypothetical protein